MAFSNLDIKIHRNKRIVIEPFNELNVQPNGYDLTIGYALSLTPDDDAAFPDTDFKSYSSKKNAHSELPSVIVPAGGNVLVVTKERVHLSGKTLAQIHARSGISARGLVLNPLTIDPNFGVGHGRLFLRLFNCSGESAMLKMDERIATLVFHSVESETDDTPGSRDQDAVLGQYLHISHVGIKVNEYLRQYGAAEDEGERNYKDSIKSMNHFRSRWRITRKLLQYKESFSWSGFSPILLAIFLNMLAVVFKMFPQLLQLIGVSSSILESPQFIVSLLALNFSYFAFLRTFSK